MPSRNQRVALVTPASLRRQNGAALRALGQARGLWACGFRDFTVFTPEPNPDLPFKQERLAVHGPLSFVFDQIEDYALIHAHQNAGLFLRGRVWADLHGFAPLESGLAWRRHPLSVRHGAAYALSRWAAGRLARRCERFICASESIAENVRRALPSAPPLEVVRNCIDAAEYEATPCETLVVGVIGAFTGRWGPTLFELAKAVAEECPEVRFRMIGSITAAQRQAAGALNNVEVLGEVDETAFRRFLKEVSVSLIVFEEWCRGGGARLKLLQSAAAGLAIAATPAGLEGFQSPPEVVVGNTVEELAELLRRHLAGDEERRRRGLALRRHVESHYDILREGRKLAELYERALGEGQRTNYKGQMRE